MSDSCCAPARRPEGPLTVDAEADRDGSTRGTHTGPMVEVPAGTFAMGYEGPLANPGEGEGPVRDVAVGAFAIGATTVTRAQFADFVEATGHETDSERFGWSFVFTDFVDRRADVRGRVRGAEWWVAVGGATWRDPHGPTSRLRVPDDHPVVHVSHADALAYCSWAGCRLPTEAEWEYAARGGLEGRIFPWGDDFRVDGRPGANIWQGDFPIRSEQGLATRGTTAVDRFAPNGYGLHQAVGNVWEWTADEWSVGDRVDPAQRVRRGGSYLCHDSYCNRYRVAARDHSGVEDATGNIGFRVAASP